MDGMHTSFAMLHDILGFKGKGTGQYYIGVVTGVTYTTDGQRALEVRFWMPKGKVLDPRPVPLTDLTGVDLIGALPDWAEWDTSDMEVKG